MDFRLIQAFEETGRTTTVAGRTFPATCVVEDPDGIRLLLVPERTFRTAVWADAHALGAAALVVGTESFAWCLTETFLAERRETRAAWLFEAPEAVLVPCGGQVPSYRDMATTEVETPRPTGFVHLHAHSEFSPLDGLTTVQEMVDAAVADGQQALAVTDHGVCASHPHLQTACQKAGIKPIFGLEAYFVNDRHRRGNPEIKGDAREVMNDYYHLTLWAMDDEGLRNLWAMSTEANREGFYVHPRMDWDTLERLNKGVMCSTGCLRGPVARPLLRGERDVAVSNLSRLYQIFGDRLYVELHTNQMEEQKIVNDGLIVMARTINAPLIAVCDSHYALQSDRHTHQVWIASQTNKDVQDEGELFASEEADYHMMSAAEVRKALSYLPDSVVEQAMNNTAVVASRCSAEIKGKTENPVYSKVGGVQRDVGRVVDMCIGNWERKCKGKDAPEVEYEERFEREMKLFISKEFCGYMLMVADYCRAAKEMGILVGPGRGSGGGSLVAYLMDITEIDPIEGDLLFERFLNEGRTEPPDFDVDFPTSRADDLLAYIVQKYGAANVVRVGSHIRLKNKGVVRALFSALRKSMDEAGTPLHWPDLTLISAIITSAEADKAGKGMEWEDLWEEHGVLLDPFREKYPELFALADRMVGRLKTYGKHAAGFIISPDEPLVGRLPLRLADDQLVAEFDMDALASLGLIKFDLLNLRNLDTIQMAVDLIKERYGITVNPYDWKEEYKDPQVWDEVSAGHTLGIFQIETRAGTKETRRMGPQSVRDLADVITLVRPGPKRSGLTESYFRRKAGAEPITVPDPKLEPILAKTYGTILYQEDVMAVCMVVAGYTAIEADVVRKILGKKQTEKVAAEGRRFVANAVERGMDRGAAETLWAQLAEFAKYGFNRAHAWGYAVLGYWCVAGPTRLYDWDRKRYVTIAKAYREGIQNIACYDEATGQTVAGRVQSVVRTGKKMGYVLRTQSNKRLECSEIHLILTDTGWRRVRDIRPGDKVASERRVSVMSAERRQSIAAGMAAYWAGISEDEAVRRVRALNDGQDFIFRSEKAKARWGCMDQVERQERIAALVESSVGGNWSSRRRGTSIECGHKYASRNEREVCRWLHQRGLEHEVQVFVNGRPADFRCQGVFIEFDGIGRDEEYFEKKFGDEPYVVIRDRGELDRDLGFLLEEELLRAGGVVTFEPVVSITPTREVVMYDVIMEGDPHNFLADGVVVHNTAWLKFHFNVQFLTAALSTVDKDRIPEFINEARRMGYKVLPPDINESGIGFKAGQMNVRYGIDSIKGVGPVAVSNVIAGQPYADFEDFLARRGKVDMGTVKLMASVGCFDSMEPNRRALERRLEWDTGEESKTCTFKDTSVVGPNGLPCTFDWTSEPLPVGKSGKTLKAKPIPKKCTRACRNYNAPSLVAVVQPYTDEQIREREKELLGVYLSSTPFDFIPEDVLDETATATEVESGEDGEYTVVAILLKARPYMPKSNKEMAFLTLNVRDGDLDVSVFSDAWTKYQRDLRPGALYLMNLWKNPRGINMSSLMPL